MFKVKCRTNLDEYKMLTWPEKIPSVPNIGDYVQSKEKKALRVVSKHWQFDGTLEIELHR